MRAPRSASRAIRTSASWKASLRGEGEFPEITLGQIGCIRRYEIAALCNPPSPKVDRPESGLRPPPNPARWRIHGCRCSLESGGRTLGVEDRMRSQHGSCANVGDPLVNATAAAIDHEQSGRNRQRSQGSSRARRCRWKSQRESPESGDDRVMARLGAERRSLNRTPGRDEQRAVNRSR